MAGESLLNDGSAMTLFTIFYNSVNGTLYTPDSITEFIFYTVLGSIVLGKAWVASNLSRISVLH